MSPTPDDRPITILIAEDQYLVRDALARLLDLEPDLTVVALAAHGREAVELAAREKPRIALLDIEMPVMDGITAAREIGARCPDTVVAMLTTFGRPGYLERALAAGARGFLLKEQPVSVLAQQIRRLAAGARIIDPELATAVLTEGPNPLSAREQEILRRARLGDDVMAIARALYLSPGTVRNYLSTAIEKLGVENRTQAVREAERRGWI
jgi:two-component system response regulator DesR